MYNYIGKFTYVRQHLHTYTQQHPKTYVGKYTYVKQRLHTYTGKYTHKTISAHIPKETHMYKFGFNPQGGIYSEHPSLCNLTLYLLTTLERFQNSTF